MMVTPRILIKLSDGQRKTPSNNLKIIRGGCLPVSTKKQEAETILSNGCSLYFYLLEGVQITAGGRAKEGFSPLAVIPAAKKKMLGVLSLSAS
ncbi:MAG: hypothetical protein ABW185_10290 [Sedimenticola sp.]